MAATAPPIAFVSTMPASRMAFITATRSRIASYCSNCVAQALQTRHYRNLSRLEVGKRFENLGREGHKFLKSAFRAHDNQCDLPCGEILLMSNAPVFRYHHIEPCRFGFRQQGTVLELLPAKIRSMANFGAVPDEPRCRRASSRPAISSCDADVQSCSAARKFALPRKHGLDVFQPQGRIVAQDVLRAVAGRQVIHDGFQWNARSCEAGLSTDDVGVELTKCAKGSGTIIALVE